MKLLILDVDGVMTDGTKTYDLHGACISKKFNDKDFTAIRRFKDAGVHVCWLSADEKVNAEVAARRHIDFFYARNPDGSINKARFIPLLAERYRVEPKDMMYVGDDFFDLGIITVLQASGGKAACPSDAVAGLLHAVDVVVHSRGGEGVVADLFELEGGKV